MTVMITYEKHAVKVLEREHEHLSLVTMDVES